MRSISLEGMQQLFAENADQPFIALLILKHPELSENVYLANNPEEIFHNGDTYLPFAFGFVLPSEREEVLPDVQIEIDNVDRRLVEGLRLIDSPPKIDIEVVRIDNAGIAHSELGPIEFLLSNVSYDQYKITASLGYEADYLREPAGKDKFTPSIAPGLFQ